VSASREDFLGAAAQALTADGQGALGTLGWWDLLSDLDDGDSRTALFALFQAQGRQLASTPAVGALMAHPYLAALGEQPGAVAAAVPRAARREGGVSVIIGEPRARVLVDVPGAGAWLLDRDDIELRPVSIPGRLEVHEITTRQPGAPALSDVAAAAARPRSVYLGRVALALEILGAAEGAVALAVQHACAREQFGQPIATFQAVRHMLAWATTDCTAVDRVAWEAVALDDGAPLRYGDIAKALAGRNARRACERALQVLGAVGFTAEHDHHHFHSRVLALDAILGTSASLTRELGAWCRDAGGAPELPSAMLLTR
jgi:hypothetical protein